MLSRSIQLLSNTHIFLSFFVGFFYIKKYNKYETKRGQFSHTSCTLSGFKGHNSVSDKDGTRQCDKERDEGEKRKRTCNLRVSSFLWFACLWMTWIWKWSNVNVSKLVHQLHKISQNDLIIKKKKQQKISFSIAEYNNNYNIESTFFSRILLYIHR